MMGLDHIKYRARQQARATKKRQFYNSYGSVGWNSRREARVTPNHDYSILPPLVERNRRDKHWDFGAIDHEGSVCHSKRTLSLCGSEA